MTKLHTFNNYCVDFDQILKEPKLDTMLKAAHKQSHSELAKMRMDFSNYKDYGEDEWNPAYFGAFVEWLAGHFLDHYGRLFNIQSIEMLDSVGSATEDYGIDGMGLSIKREVKTTTGRVVLPNSPVYLQVKGTMNRTKEYQANDGTRLPNFGLHAMSDAIQNGGCYQARYLIFTTGAGLHYSLEKMSRGFFEVVNYKKIKALMDGDTVFLNKLRDSVGLTTFPVTQALPDAEWRLTQATV